MKIYFKALLAAILVGAMFFGLFALWRSRTQSEVGIKKIAALTTMETNGVPVFESKDLKGNKFNLESLRDDVVIVNFWASWCGPCVEEVPSLISLVEAMGGKLKLVAVSGDNSKEDLNAFLKAFPKLRGENITIIWDEDRSLSRLYGVDRLPESFVVGKNLHLAKKIVGGIPWHTKDSEAYIGELVAK